MLRGRDAPLILGHFLWEHDMGDDIIDIVIYMGRRI